MFQGDQILIDILDRVLIVDCVLKNFNNQKGDFAEAGTSIPDLLFQQDFRDSGQTGGGVSGQEGGIGFTKDVGSCTTPR